MIAALFPGQGSQHVGMGKELYEEFPIVREIFEEASDATNLHIKKLCFNGSESDLKLTANTQPCLLTVAAAAFSVVQKEFNFRPTITLGHSLGEYAALVAARSLKFFDAVKWVKIRGQAMQEAVPEGAGTMAAVMGLEDTQVEQLCQRATEMARQKNHSAETVETIVEPANYNAPGQLVVAGSQDAVEELILILKTETTFKGGKAVPLPVSAPFHCRLMKPARKKMKDLFANLTESERPSALLCPYIPNRTSRITHETDLILPLLEEQIDHPVLWKQSVSLLLEQNYIHAIEFGPGKVLQNLAKRIATPLQKSFTVLPFHDKGSIQALESFLKSGELTP